MMRGIIVFITAGLAVCLLREKRYVHHWLALCFIVGGVAIVGAVSLLSNKYAAEGEEATSALGIILLLVS